MASPTLGKHFNSFSELSQKAIQMSDNTAKKILNGRESLSKTEFQNTSLFSKYQNNENFTKLVNSFGSEIDVEELSFLITVLDASKYNVSDAYGEYSVTREDGTYIQDKDVRAYDEKAYDELVDSGVDSSKPDSSQGFYLDGYCSNIDNILDVSHEDFKQFKQARSNANKPDMGL